MSPIERNLPACVVVAFGSNVPSQAGDPAITISSAAEHLCQHEQISKCRLSTIHQTDPVGPMPQPIYANACMELETTLEPQALMRLLLETETIYGRDRSREQRWGPRTLDLDLLLFDDQIIEQPGLSVPHPRMHERLFVLAPLAELCPERVVPGVNETVQDLLKQLRIS